MTTIIDHKIGERGRAIFTIVKDYDYYVKVTVESPFLMNFEVKCPTWNTKSDDHPFYEMVGSNGKFTHKNYVYLYPISNNNLYTAHVYYYTNGLQIYLDEILFKMI